ncbi:MAG: aminopeptidase [Spirochaetales bacterium]|nr:aminopeptidase [Spirochaetales bacterium]
METSPSFSLETFWDAYARLAVETGINLDPGRAVLISTGWETYEFARRVAREAYRRGAALVKIDVRDETLTADRIAFSPSEFWTLNPPGLESEYSGYAEDAWARIAIEDLGASMALEGVDAEALRILRQSKNALLRPYQAAQMADRFPWVVIAAPSPTWVKKLGLKNEVELAHLLTPLLLLDSPDPSRAWEKKMNKIEARCRTLNAHGLQKLHFKGPGTDLEIGLRPEHRWTGGASLFKGRPFLCNIPTEEVFTSPDAGATQGRVSLTKPVAILGAQVHGGWLVFQNGKVTDCGAEKNAKNLERYLEVDEGAKSLGEVALVDEDSPIAKSGRLFGSSLYDENAACHIALGAAYPICYADPEALISDEDKKARGCNLSSVHTDVMIGSNRLDVVGIDAQGNEVKILSQGHFVGDFR